MSKVVQLKDGLYAKIFSNGICQIDGRPWTFKKQLHTPQFVKIEGGRPYLADSEGQPMEELVPVTGEAVL